MKHFKQYVTYFYYIFTLKFNKYAYLYFEIYTTLEREGALLRSVALKK